MSGKSIYEEAIADVKKLKELAESNAKLEVLKSVEPRIKQLVESHLLEMLDDEEVDEAEMMPSGDKLCPDCNMPEDRCECEVDEASGVAAIAGYTAPLGMDPHANDKKRTDEDVQYEVTEESVGALASLTDFSCAVTDDKFVAGVYRMHESVQKCAFADRETKLSEAYMRDLDGTIAKLEDMYVYLRESYAGDDARDLEDKLERSHGLLNAVKETTMKMKDLLREGEVTFKVTGLPDDVDVDSLNIDLIADEEAPGDEAAAGEAAPEGAAPAAEAPAAPAAEQPALEAWMHDGDEDDEGAKKEDDEEDEDEMIEISESDIRREIARLRSGTVNESEITDYGDGSDEGDPMMDDVSGLEQLEESDEEDEDEGKMDELGLKRKEEEMGVDKADNHCYEADMADDEEDEDEGAMKMESARRNVRTASKALSAARGTVRESVARARYRKAISAYRTARVALSESAKKKTPAAAVKNTADGNSKKLAEAIASNKQLRQQLTETNLLNAKLIHANKLLRIEGLTKSQQTMVIDRLDEARSLREVRLISESLVKVLASNAKGSVTESTRRPSGSASRPTGSTGTAQTLNEGSETARWAQLAGLTKK